MNPVANSVWIWRIGLGLAAVVLLWRMVILGGPPVGLLLLGLLWWAVRRALPVRIRS